MGLSLRHENVKTTFSGKVLLILLGIFLGLAIIELSLQAGEFILYHIQRSDGLMSGNGTYKILALGESTTTRLYNGQGSWPEELEKILNNRSITRFKVYNEGVPGTKTSLIVSKLDRFLIEYRPDMVITMMGINDHYDILHYDASQKPTLKIIKLSRWLALSLKGSNEKPYPDESTCDGDLPDDLIQIKNDLYQSVLNGTIGTNYPHYESQLDDLEMRYNGSCSFYNEIGGYYLYRLLVTSNLTTEVRSYFYNRSFYYLNKADALSPNNFIIKQALGSAYLRLASQNGDDREMLFKSNKNFEYALGLNSDNYHSRDWVLTSIAEVYLKLGFTKENLSDIFELRGYPNIDFIIPATEKERTKESYQVFYQKVKQRKIKWIVMQYPTKPIEELKSYLNNTNDVIYAGNEENFRSALQNHTYKDIFIDAFGKTFGHATMLGNKLIAENLADIILSDLNMTG